MGRVAIDCRPVGRLQRAGLGRGSNGVGADGAHERPRRAQPGPRHRGRRTHLGQHRDDGLADPERRERRLQVVDGRLRVRPDRFGQGLLVVGSEGANRVLDARTQLAEHVVGNVGRQLGAEEDADALGPDQLDGLLDLVQERLGRVGEQQVRLVEEEDQLRLVRVTDLGQRGEQVRQHPHEERREQHRTGGLATQLQQRDDAAALRVQTHQVLGLEFGQSEERVSTLGLEVDQRTQDHARGGRRHRTERLELLFALITGQELDDAAQVLQVIEEQPLLVCPVKDQPERRLLSLVQPQHLRQQNGPEAGDCRAHRDARTRRPQRQELDGERGRCPVVAGVFRPLGGLVAGRAGLREPGQVALDVGHHDRHPGRRQLLGDDLQRLGLAGTGRAGDQAVTVDGGERNLDLSGGIDDPVDDHSAEVQGLAGDVVTSGDLLRGGCTRVSRHAPDPTSSGRW